MSTRLHAPRPDDARRMPDTAPLDDRRPGEGSKVRRKTSGGAGGDLLRQLDVMNPRTMFRSLSQRGRREPKWARRRRCCIARPHPSLAPPLPASRRRRRRRGGRADVSGGGAGAVAWLGIAVRLGGERHPPRLPVRLLPGDHTAADARPDPHPRPS